MINFKFYTIFRYFFILLIFLFIVSVHSFSDEIVDKEIIKPLKIILIKSENSHENSFYSQITNETIAVLDKLDSEMKIVYLKEKKWSVYKHLLNDLSNKENLSKFYLLTGTLGIIFLNIEKKQEKISINLILYNIFEDKRIIETFDLYEINLIDNMGNYYNFVYDKIKNFYTEIDVVKFRKQKIDALFKKRKNPYNEILLSGGTGFYMRQSIGGNLLSSGFSTYLNFEPKTQNFVLSFTTKFSALFNDTNSLDNNNFFLFNIVTGGSINFWLLNEKFRLGLGVNLDIGQYHNEIIEYDNNDEEEYYFDKFILGFLIPFLSFSFLPVRHFQIIFDIGSFFSPLYLQEYGPSRYFQLYLKILFRYFIFKKMYMEISMPFYMFEKYNADNDRGSIPYFQVVLDVGFGWRFEFWNKK